MCFAQVTAFVFFPCVGYVTMVLIGSKDGAQKERMDLRRED